MNEGDAILLGGENRDKEGEVPQGPSLPPLRTAFVVFLDPDGQWGASNDPNLLADSVEIEKIAHPDEIYAGSSAIQADIIAQKTAAMVQQLMMVAARQAQEAAMNQAILAKTGLKK